jgi:hypothetical protein
MRRDPSPFQLALFLVLGCVVLRMLGAMFPAIIPNASPLMALAFVSGIYFPRRWGWLVGPAACLVTELALIPYSYKTIGIAFPWWGLASLPIYLLAAGLGLLIAPRRSLGKVIGGSLALSVLFYVAANTFCWAASVLTHSTPGYPAGLAGWWQANSTGIPGYPPTWIFLRNGVLGDLFFLAVLLLILDRALLLAPFAGRTTAAASRPV